MGALAEGLAEYARPLLEETDGSPEQLDKAFALASVFYNMGLLTEPEREKSLAALKSSVGMGDDEFEDFRRSVVIPMLQRYNVMFGGQPSFMQANAGTRPDPAATNPGHSSQGGRYPGTPRNSLCPCGSGKKYKRCCGR